MEYTPEQKAIIARMGDASRRIREARIRHKAAQRATGLSMIEAVTNLAIVMEQSNELHALLDEKEEAFHEFLDSL